MYFGGVVDITEPTHPHRMTGKKSGKRRGGQGTSVPAASGREEPDNPNPSSPSSVPAVSGREEGSSSPSTSVPAVSGQGEGTSESSVPAASGREEKTPSSPSTSGQGRDTLATGSSKAGLGRDRPKERAEKSKKVKETHERIVRALWPTTELKKEFREATGSDPDPGRLMDSTRFRDIWGHFDASDKPTTKDLLAVRKLAREIQGKRRSQTRPESKTQETESKKRKNRSFSLSPATPLERGTPPTRGAASFKIPRLAGPPTKSSEVRTSAEPATIPEEEETDVIEDEAREPGLEDFADDIRAALPSYANVAGKGERRKDFPYILYVHTGEEERKTMSKETWTCFFEKMQVTCLNLTLKGEAVPKIEWSGYAKGVGLIAPADEASRTLVKDLAANVKVAEFTFRAWARGEKGKYIPLSIRLPATMPSTDFSSGKFMQAATISNGLPDKYVIRGCKQVAGGGKERLLRIGAEPELVDALKRLDGVMFVAMSRLEVYYQGTRLTNDTTI